MLLKLRAKIDEVPYVAIKASPKGASDRHRWHSHKGIRKKSPAIDKD
jgi:hypothetical protein